ncbi:uncharacterized protein LOC136086346 [Hydra vulgaris]|uniref:Uncharacterized protein LOC136086346 n=1 Tax=Hydra vulgaris TaxID=6087 RepID=A0ABM4CS46_HYDVU
MITKTKKLLPSHEESKGMRLGKTVTDHLRIYANSKKSTYTTFGIRDEDGIFNIGKKPIHINDDGELIVKFNPNKGVYSEDNLKIYRNIVIQTDAVTSENPYKPKSSCSEKYREKIAPMWKDIKENRKRESKGKGEGTKIQTIILHSNPDALVEKLNLCIAAWRAGNTGARNEAVAIYDELLRQVHKKMLIVNNKRYIKKHAVGGSGIFESIRDLFKRIKASNVTRLSSAMLKKMADTDLGKTAITGTKSAGNEKSKEILSNLESSNDLIYNGSEIAKTINKMMMGSAIRSVKKVSNKNARKIEDMVKQGRGLRLA